MTKTSITFQGRVYTRDPLSPRRHRRVYYWGTHRKALHRDIWEDFWGPIPEKQVVHHINGNPLDNRLENLALMTASAHARHHWVEAVPVTKACRQCRAPFTRVCWGKSVFCSNACKAAWRRASGLDDEKRTCTRCGGMFTVNRYAKQEHCSYQCAGRGTYQRQTFAFTCVECGSPATAHDVRARFCSSACGKRHRRRKRLDQTAV